MERGSKRISLVVNSNEQHERWKDFASEKWYGNLSRLVRCAVDIFIKRENEEATGEKVMEPFQDALEGLYKLTEATNEWVEIISMRLADKGSNSEIIKAGSDILDLLLKEEMALSRINGNFNYSREVISGALVLINDLGLIGSRKERSTKRQDNSGGIE